MKAQLGFILLFACFSGALSRSFKLNDEGQEFKGSTFHEIRKIS